jgi:GNAT superfamily N-acetyltransferase
MNDQIVDNLYKFWREIGKLTNKLAETEYYSAVSMDDSDWPNRIFDLKNNKDINFEIINPSKEGKLPTLISIPAPNDLRDNPDLVISFSQKNMCLDLKSHRNKITNNRNIKRVKTEKDAIAFAKTATESFGYQVDFNVIHLLITNSKSIRLFIYKEKKECLGCGIVFFDSNNNAGLHMIGTIHEGRGKGIGKSMTERLLFEAKENNMNFAVLHASSMGESIYRKQGFESYEKIETYKISRKGTIEV